MPAYIIGQVAVHDLTEYNKYLAGFPEAFAPFEGRVLVASDQVETIEGVWPKARTVVLEFPSIDHARRWYNSPAYQTIAQYRFKAATSNIILTEGWKG
jgi:uncharacterized protein (DUF1330 family)